jgi:hypothetical protein
LDELDAYWLADTYIDLSEQFTEYTDYIKSLINHAAIPNNKIPNTIHQLLAANAADESLPIHLIKWWLNTTISIYHDIWQSISTELSARMTVQQLLNLFKFLFISMDHHQLTNYMMTATHLQVARLSFTAANKLEIVSPDYPAISYHTYDTLECIQYHWYSREYKVLHRTLEDGPAYYCASVPREYRAIAVYAQNGIITNNVDEPSMIIDLLNDSGQLRFYSDAEGYFFKMVADSTLLPIKLVKWTPNTDSTINSEWLDSNPVFPLGLLPQYSVKDNAQPPCTTILHQMQGKLRKIVWRNDADTLWVSPTEYCTTYSDGTEKWYSCKNDTVKYPCLITCEADLGGILAVP